MFRDSPLLAVFVCGFTLCFVAYSAITLAYDTGRRALGAEISYVCAP